MSVIEVDLYHVAICTWYDCRKLNDISLCQLSCNCAVMILQTEFISVRNKHSLVRVSKGSHYKNLSPTQMME
jgi:hypothetical protein